MLDEAAVACWRKPFIMPEMNTAYRLPEELQTSRYLLRQVMSDDAEAIFDSYGTDVIANRYLGWKPHQRVQETKAFLERVAREWDDAAGFPLVAFDREAPRELVGMFHPHMGVALGRGPDRIIRRSP